MKIELTREEALAIITQLESRRNARYIGEWGKSALTKLLNAMGIKDKEVSND